MEPIFELESLEDLASYLQTLPARRLRPRLIKSFWSDAIYLNVEQWNRAVRLCEALAIIGWGDCEPVEAVRDTYFNGWLTSTFYNRYGEKRCLEAMWSNRKQGLEIVRDEARWHGSPDLPEAEAKTQLPTFGPPQNLPPRSQRNWIVKNPIWLGQTVVNCYPASDALVRAAKRLRARLDAEMQPQHYGTAINQISIYFHLSYRDPGCATNYVIHNDSAKLTRQEKTRRLRKLFSAKEIKAMRYELVPRYLFRPFHAATGRMNVSIHLPKEFSEQPARQQKRGFAELVRGAAAGAVARLSNKKLPYDFAAMQSDLDRILKAWAR